MSTASNAASNEVGSSKKRSPEQKKEDESVLKLNVVSIFIGVIIARILVAWFATFRFYIEHKCNKEDPDQSLIDYYSCVCCLVGSLIVTSVGGLIIIFTFSWYRNHH